MIFFFIYQPFWSFSFSSSYLYENLFSINKLNRITQQSNKAELNLNNKIFDKMLYHFSKSIWENLKFGFFRNNLNLFSTWPKFQNSKLQSPKTIVNVIHSSQASSILSAKKFQQFTKDHKVVIQKQDIKQVYLCQKLWERFNSKLNLGYSIEGDSHVEFSQKFIKQVEYSIGFASLLLSTAFKFSRKQQEKGQALVSLNSFEQRNYVLELVQAQLRAKQWTNARANEANTSFFLKQSERIFKLAQSKFGEKTTMTIFRGNQLLDQGFRLMHAVGRASLNEPIFINLSYKGSSKTDEYHALVGKGVCFDSGGLNLKPSSGISGMHMDKHGAASVLSAFQSIINQQLAVNVTASMGFVQNFINQNSYRPLDIIKSRKGLTVEIGNTDAEGRLVLADCMHWTQQKYKCKDLIQLSTLTGAIVVALGKKYAGLFSNSEQLSSKLVSIGNNIGQKLWRMPVDSYHHEFVKAKNADIKNASKEPNASSCQAAAFLQNFVEKNVQWAHIDIAGTSNIDSTATGYGAKLLVEYLKKSI